MRSRLSIWRLFFLALSAAISDGRPVAVALAEPPRDRPFTVTWEQSGIFRDVWGVHFVDAQIGWVVGKNGMIVALRDGGASWEVQKSGTDKDLTAAHFSDAHTGWAVGAAGTIMATRDGGANWTAQKSGTDQGLNAVHFVDSRTGWVVGKDGTALVTHDGGANWQPIFKKEPGTRHTYYGFSGVNFADSQTGWMVAEDGTILATQDGGASWQRQTRKDLYNIHFVDARAGWVVGENGTILATRDGGTTWQAQKSGTAKRLQTVRFADARVGWVIGENGTILATRDGGANWEAQSSGTDAALDYAYFADARNGWVIGENGTILATRDGGVTWTPQESGTNKDLASVHFLGDAQTGWVVGGEGTILATRDSGATWQAQKSGTDKLLEDVRFADARVGWVVGEAGTILATKDGGSNWEAQRSGTDKHLFGMYFADAQTGWAVGEADTILATKDGGRNWEAQRSETGSFLTAVHFADARTGWAVGTVGTILATQDGGATWEKMPDPSQNLASVYFADTRAGWAVGEGGTILATRDGGIIWQKQTSGTDKHLSGVVFADPRTGWVVGENGTILATQDGGTTWQAQKSGTDWALSRVYFADSRTGWVVGENGTILATQDGGASWHTQIHNLWNVHFVDARTGWVVGEHGTILATRDGGTTWQTQKSGTDISLASVRFADARTGWAVGENGTILATRDGGASWEVQNSRTDNNLGTVYFADARTGWVVGAKGTILATRDGGATWQAQQSDTDKFLEDVYFVETRTGWVVGDSGTILATQDGGASWVVQKSGTKEDLGRVYFADARTGWAMAHRGILATRDGGASWEAQEISADFGRIDLPQPSSPALSRRSRVASPGIARTRPGSGAEKNLWSFQFANAWTGWVVGSKGTILATRDGGRSWQAEESGTDEDLNGVRFAGAHTGWAVGDNGTLLRAGPPLYAPWVDAARVETSAAGLTSELDVSFTLHNDDNVAIRSLSLFERVGRAEWTLLGAPKKLDDVSGRWHFAWYPAEFGIHPGDEVEYRVRVDDGGPPLAPFELDRFTYLPWLAQLWREHQNAVIGALSASAVLMSYAGVFALLLVIAPARLARVGGAPGLDDLAKPSGTLGFVWDLARKGFGHVTLPYLCRHPRVRRAWTKRYREGRANLRELGKPARESFVTEPEVLDAWVQPRIRRVMAALDRLELFKQRRIYVELPVRVGERQGSPMVERPSAETLREYFAQQRAVVAIVGGGGSGKSSLACALARWAIADDPKDRLAEHRMLPVLIVEDTTDLVKSVTRNLRRMLGEEELPDDLVRGLLAKQRLLVIVDALSEREPATQRHVEQVFGEDVSVNAIVITSRTEPMLGAVDRTTLYPVRLDAARVVPFIIGYLDRMEHAETLKDGRVQLRLGERILALAEAGGRRTPVTPLLVTLFVDSAVDRAAEGGSFDDMPDVVPEVFVDYLRRLNSGGAEVATAVPNDVFIEAARILASVSLGPNLVPRDFSVQEAVDGLAKGRTDEQAQTLMNHLVASGLIERRTPGGIAMLRFSLDPAAEYLAAIRNVFELKATGRDGWQTYLDELARREGYPDVFDGYLMALATCYRAYRHEFRLPDIRVPWEDEGKDLYSTRIPRRKS